MFSESRNPPEYSTLDSQRTESNIEGKEATMRSREKLGDQGLVFLVGLFFAFLLAGNIAVTGANASVAEIWSVPISKYAYSVSVSDSGRAVVVVGVNKVAYMRVYSAQGQLEKNWRLPRGLWFNSCLIHQDYVLAAYGDTVSLFGNGGKEQLWVDSFSSLWSAPVMSVGSKRIAVASGSPVEKSTIWMLNMEGDVLWSHQIESSACKMAITPEGFVVAGGEKYGYFADKGRDAVYLFRPNGSLAWWKETDSPVIDIAVSDDCSYVVAGLDNGGMLFLDRDGHVVWEKEAIGAWVDMSGDGQRIVASSLNGLVVLGVDGNIIWQSDALGYFPGDGGNLNISRNGKTIVGLEAAMIYEGNRVCVFDRAGENVYSDTDSSSSPRVAVSESGQFVAIAFARKLILLRCEW